jgi:hypothetical protein
MENIGKRDLVSSHGTNCIVHDHFIVYELYAFLSPNRVSMIKEVKPRLG